MRIFNEFSEYDQLAMRTAYHPTGSQQALLYCACSLTGEAGEVANEIKKVVRDDGGKLTDERRKKLIGEIGDVLWYLNTLSREIGTTLAFCAMANIDKLEQRHADKLDTISKQPAGHKLSLVPHSVSGVRL